MLRAHLLGAVLGRLLEPVVVVDQAVADLPLVDRVEDEAVLLVLLHVVGNHGAQPCLGLGIAEFQSHRGDEGLERCVGRSHTDLAPVLGGGEVHDARGHGGLRHRLAVVGDHPRPAGDAGPRAVGGPVRRGHGRGHAGRQRREEAGVRNRAEGAGVLGEEDIGGRAVALLHQLSGEFGGRPVADLGVDARGLLEGLDQWSDQGLAAARVDHQGGRPGAGGRGAGRSTARTRGEQRQQHREGNGDEGTSGHARTPREG